MRNIEYRHYRYRVHVRWTSIVFLSVVFSLVQIPYENVSTKNVIFY